ncbi:MAG: hypothetical protein QMC74_07155 [Myxococcota bacterium]|jgi:hypothetical protein
MIDLVEIPIERWLAGAVAFYMAWPIGAMMSPMRWVQASGRDH